MILSNYCISRNFCCLKFLDSKKTALQVLWLPTTLLLTEPLDYLWRNSTSSPLTTHRTTVDRPIRLPVTKQHFKLRCGVKTALQVLLTYPPQSTGSVNPLDYRVESKLHFKSSWLPTALPLTDPLNYLVTKQHFESFDFPAHYCWPSHSTTYDEMALQVLWLPTHYRWLTHSTTCDETALQVLWLPTALPLTDQLNGSVVGSQRTWSAVSSYVVEWVSQQ